MKYQRKLHDAFASKAVPARVRRAAFDVTAEADAEIAGLLAKVKALQDALLANVERTVSQALAEQPESPKL